MPGDICREGGEGAVRRSLAWLGYSTLLTGHSSIARLRLSALEASKRIDLGPYRRWRGPARLYMNVERAYREFRNEAADAPWDHAKVFDAVRAVAKAKGIEVEF